MPAHANPRAVV